VRWEATHILKLAGTAPLKVMVSHSSLEAFTKKQWDNAEPALYALQQGTNLAFRMDKYGDITGESVGTFTQLGAREPGSSITALRSPVERLTDVTVRRGGKQRQLVVRLLPGGVLELREAGCRKRRLLPFSEAWHVAGKLEAQKLIRERKAARAAKRKP
jgi:hypothetical protein